MKLVSAFMFGVLFCFGSMAQESQNPKDVKPIHENDPQETREPDAADMDFNMNPSADSNSGTENEGKAESPLRFTLNHEISSKIDNADGLVNDRSSFRVEYSKFVLNNFYLRLDSSVTRFWPSDHRSVAEDSETRTREAFIQGSFGDTSIKLGNQIIVWGESDGGAITDVISPRNLSELFFISLEESRVSQPMLTIDQFSAVGDWSSFYIPNPSFNEYPKKGTAYYYDPFNGLAEFHDEDSDRNDSEYGLRWKKTFGRSDVSIMTARLMDNDYAFRQDGFTSAGKMVITRLEPRFSMSGITFNYALGSFLFSGEIAKKSPKDFNDANFNIIEKDLVDSSFRTEYSLGKAGSHSVSVELVNNRVLDWSEEILGTPESKHSVVFGWNDSFFNENLTINWISIYNKPYSSNQHSIFMTYKWSNDITLHFDAFYLTVKDKQSDLYIYRDKNNVSLKIQYQF